MSPPSGAAEEATEIVRLRLETMPSVTVPLRPSGEPMATAVSPTLSLLESPRVAGVRSRPFASIFSTARSEVGSVPTTWAERTEPSDSCTSAVAFAVAPSRVTTWVLVRMWPCLSRITPEPVPDSPLPVTAMVTTEGEAFCAAAVTSLTELWSLTMVVPPLPEEELVEAEFASISPVVPAAAPPPISAATAIPAIRVPAPNRRRSRRGEAGW
ncbi:Uncharacterised protein [Mycobacteroides abscessus subsp. abscessus]|nr:Uncharacterised protein [Mycobacteroides abscessus subsp. abscessus]